MRPSSTVTNRAYWNGFINATTKSRCSIDSICNNKKKHERAIDYLCSSQYSVMLMILILHIRKDTYTHGILYIIFGGIHTGLIPERRAYVC